MKMKALLLFVMLLIACQAVGQSSLDSWIEEVKSAIIAGDNMEQYSLHTISPDVTIDFVLVEDLNVTYQDSSIIQMEMIGPDNSKTGCLEFSYVRSKNDFYLQFGDVRELTFMGTTKKFVSPWIQKPDSCTR